MAPDAQPPEALVALAGILVAEQSLEATLSEVVALACRFLPGGDVAGVTLLEREGRVTAVATEEMARQVDVTQYRVGAGPCLDAYRHQQIFRIDDTATDDRWPQFCARAHAAGILSTLSLPLVVAGDGLGALNVYCRRVNGFSERDRPGAASFASFASVAVANSREYWRAQTLARQLSEALRTRGVIEQAKGILISQQGCSADEAFDLLVRASQRSHTKLHDLADEIVERARRQAPAPPSGGPPAAPDGGDRSVPAAGRPPLRVRITVAEQPATGA